MYTWLEFHEENEIPEEEAVTCQCEGGPNLPDENTTFCENCGCPA